MSKNMLIHDTRLEGGTPSGLAANNYTVDESSATQHIFGWAGYYAKSQGGLDNIFIMCHGLEWALLGATTYDYVLGGGLLLGTENLTFANTSCTSALKGFVQTITLFSCGPANTAPGKDGTFCDGARFCGEIALYSGAEVIAAVKTQIYNFVPAVKELGKKIGADGPIDFGGWEGSVYRFDPTSGAASRVM